MSRQQGFAIPLILIFVAILTVVGVGAVVALKIPSHVYNLAPSSQHATTTSFPATQSATENKSDDAAKQAFYQSQHSSGSSSTSCQGVTPPKESAEGAFTNSLTDINLIDHISNGDTVGDSRFTYLWIKSGQTVSIYAPADGVLTYIAYKTRADLDPSGKYPDYDVAFLVDCKTLYRINHITNPDPSIIAARTSDQPTKLEVGKPPSNENTKPTITVTVKAGQKIGTTTGTSNAHNFDFGVFVNNVATCPYKQFDTSLSASWLELFKRVECKVSGNY